MNQLSSIGFGPDAETFSAYAQRGNERLGNVDFIFENRGENTARIQVRRQDGTTTPSGYAAVGDAVVVVPGGTVTASYNILDKRIAFFGSGNTATDLSGTATSTSVGITAVIRNKGDLRGAQISIVAVGRRGWGYDEAFNRGELTKAWGSPPDRPDIDSVS